MLGDAKNLKLNLAFNKLTCGLLTVLVGRFYNTDLSLNIQSSTLEVDKNTRIVVPWKEKFGFLSIWEMYARTSGVLIYP